MFGLMLRFLFLLLFCSHILFAKQPLIIDTDVGYDDLMAIMSLVQKSEFDVKAITITGTGLAHPEKGLENTRRLLTLLNKNIPTAYGRGDPFEDGHLYPEDWREKIDAISERFQDFGAETIDLPQESNAVALLAETLESSLEKVTLLTLGPLTNIGELFLKRPDLIQKINKIYTMGGALSVSGNLSIIKDSVAEWNMYADPQAVKVVMQAGIPIYLIPLDATIHVPLTLSFYDEFKKTYKGTPKEALFLQLLNGVVPWIDMDGFFFWDVVAAEILCDHSLAHFQYCKIDIVTGPEPDSGRTFFSENGFPVHVALTVDGAKLLQTFCKTLK